MKVMVGVTTYNEEESIGLLIESLLKQSKKPSEIIIVDAGSTDDTIAIIRKFQRSHKKIRLFVKECSRAEGRNLAVYKAKYDIIAMTDAGCVARFDWLENITLPFKNKSTDVVAGFYKMVGEKPIQKAASVFLGVLPDKFNDKYLPSARSLAFKKDVWRRVGGFPENLKSTAEDTIFVHNLLKSGCEIVRVKNAIVEWRMPETLREVALKFYSYAKGDAESGVFWYEGKGLTSHNIKVFLVFIRYFLGIFLLLTSFENPQLWPILASTISLYIIYSFAKTYKVYNNINIGLWGIVLQFVSDLSVMTGFLVGMKSSAR